LAAGLGLIAVAAVVVLLSVGQGGDPVRDAVVDLRPGERGPFHIRLEGPLWADRTRTGADGARDVAQVTSDRPLRVRIRARAGVSIARVELRVDGRQQRVVTTRCVQGRCPASFAVTVVPRLRGLAPGDHGVEVVVRDARGPHGARRFDVRSVARVPPAAETEPLRAVTSPPPSPQTGRLARDAGRVLEQERASPRLAGALGGARLTVVQVGELNVNGLPLGATMLVRLVAPRRDVSAVVPGYVPSDGDTSAPYRAQRVRMRVDVLRDALIDIDLATRRVIGFEPGPGSRTASWAPSEAAAPVGSEDED
jgi:hypothetical protein